MCAFCEHEEKFGEVESSTGTWLHAKTKGKDVLFYRHRNLANACGIHINFCPFCGRNLSEDDKRSDKNANV